ncbi:MAG: radical SAM protein, partial [Methanobacteriota archaeon]
MSIQLHVASLPDLVEPPSSEDTEGCLQCQQGSKMVLFVTGRCHWRCDYCPLSENRREIEYIYANERRCDPDDWEAVLEEAHAMNATGTGITGGDPMMDRERTLESIRQLKREFGSQHHIHMYTSIPFQPPQATALADAGLDEIRFHLLDLELEPYLEIMEACEQAGMKTGVELPCEPDQEERLLALLEELRDAPITFLNLNELEITVGNLDNMELRGFNISNELTAGAEG